MRIKKVVSQHRRDFFAIYECEYCGFEDKGRGYDDSYFHKNVIPSMKCSVCKKTASQDYQPIATKYPEGYEI